MMMANSGLLRSINIIPKNAVWSPGYISSEGSIASPSAINKEVYTRFDIIPSGSHRLLPLISLNSNVVPWLGVGQFDSNGGWLGRPTFDFVMSAVGDKYYALPYNTLLLYANTSSLIVSFRTYGDADIMLIDEADILTLGINNGITNHVTA